jgi:1,4-alpha-glucan branching enzyme
MKAGERPEREPKPSAIAPPPTDAQLLLRAEHGDPFAYLGPHAVERDGRRRYAVRVVQTHASGVTVLIRGHEIPAYRIEPEGVFEAFLPPDVTERPGPRDYRLRIHWHDGNVSERIDPYAFHALLSEFDLHLIGEGTHYQLYECLGAHVREIDGVRGVQFAVWAPNALRVSVVGDFNTWDGRVYPMRSRGSCGVWEIFLPEIGEGEVYKFEVRSRLGPTPFMKADPYAFHAELRPCSGSIVASLDSHRWNDSAWMESRRNRNWLAEPVSFYEVHAASWRRKDGHQWLSYRELAEQLIPYVKQMGFTHIELLPIMEHPFDGSWGYQTVGYFAATSRFGSPDDFMYFVDRCHQEGLGVVLDWTPAHFPNDSHGLAQFDGSHLYEHADPRMGQHPDWGTAVFNYGRTEVQNFLVANALFWLDKYHLDGLRVDAVASMLYLDYSRQAGEWIPNEFGGRENLAAIALIKRMNEAVHARYPGTLTIAEESTSWPAVSRPTYVGGLGFSLKWNMGWMHDTLDYFSKDPIHRRFHHGGLTFSMLYAFTENFVLPFSHDEVVHGKGSLINKMPGDLWQQFANLRLLYSYMYAHPGKKLLFMGAELGQRSEWNHDTALEWELLQFPQHRGIQRLLSDLNALLRREPALHQQDFDWQGFEWLDCNDADNSILTFIRRAANPADFLVVAVNFTPVVRESYRVGVPEPGYYAELFNSDAEEYSGSGQGNLGGVSAEPTPWGGRPFSLNLRLPPLAALILKKRN